jgi:predicted  nucleic acid-binding Zn-ribbon protein
MENIQDNIFLNDLQDNDTSYEMVAAKTSPSEVNKVSGFWKHNRNFRVAVVVSLFIFIGTLPYTLVWSFWTVLSIVAILLGFRGMWAAFNEIRKIEVENSLIIKIKEMGRAYINNDERCELTDLRNQIAPVNSSSLAPIRLIDHVANEAMISKFDSGVNLIQPYQNESLEVIFKLQNYQKIALWVGIAGTFIGIIGAISSEIIAGLEKDFFRTITLMFDSLAISFSASLAGLVSAIVIGWFILIIRKKQEIYFKNMEGVVTIILTAARKSKNKDKYLSDIDKLKEDLTESRSVVVDLQQSILRMQQSINQIQQQIVSQNNQIQKSIDRFIVSNEKLNGVVSQTEHELKAAHDSIALKATLEASIKNAGEQMSVALSQQVSALTGQMNRFRESADLLNESVRKYSAQTNSFGTSLSSELNQLTNKIHNFKILQIGFFGFLDRLFNGKR